jgi:peroxiredoxin
MRTSSLLPLVVTLACDAPRPGPSADKSRTQSAPAPEAKEGRKGTPSETKPDPGHGVDPAPAAEAEVGKPAPDFELTDLDGKTHRLADYGGKTVVLEWFNPECPFVNFAHDKGPLEDMAAKQSERGIVWLAINSGAPGKQGHGIEKNEQGRERFGLAHPILLDEDGSVGHRYGAVKTPHMFLIDPEGVLRYAGAIDNAPFGEVDGEGDHVNHVETALADLAGGKDVATATTSAYGCTVKYARKG